MTDDRPHTLDAVYVRQLGTMTFGEGARRKDANRGIELTDLVLLAVRCYRQNSDDDGYRESCSCHVIANSNMLYCPKSGVTLRVMQSGRSPQDVNERVHARMDFVKEVGTEQIRSTRDAVIYTSVTSPLVHPVYSASSEVR